MEPQHKKILIVDDDSAFRDMLKEEFSKRGMSVTEAKNADEGLSMIKANNPDAVIADVMMPGRSGIDLIKEVRQIPEYAHTFFVVLTNSTKSEDVADAMEENVTVFLQKASVDPISVADTVESHFKSNIA